MRFKYTLDTSGLYTDYCVIRRGCEIAAQKLQFGQGQNNHCPNKGCILSRMTSDIAVSHIFVDLGCRH